MERAPRSSARPSQPVLFTKNRSGHRSPSKSSTTTPLPMVSGIHFSPKAPVAWTKSIPAAAVTSVKRIEVVASLPWRAVKLGRVWV